MKIQLCALKEAGPPGRVWFALAMVLIIRNFTGSFPSMFFTSNYLIKDCMLCKESCSFHFQIMFAAHLHYILDIKKHVCFLYTCYVDMLCALTALIINGLCVLTAALSLSLVESCVCVGRRILSPCSHK